MFPFGEHFCSTFENFKAILDSKERVILWQNCAATDFLFEVFYMKFSLIKNHSLLFYTAGANSFVGLSFQQMNNFVIEPMQNGKHYRNKNVN